MYRQARDASQLARVNNQGVYISPSYNQYGYTTAYAKGGSLRTRYLDYQEHVNRENRESKRAQHRRDQLSTKKLDRDLDRLSKEQMILLRSIFK